jgi:hypothetical protein
MSGVLHPVGPEPTSTYWWRRAVVLAVLAVALAIVISLATRGNDSQQAVPAGPTSETFTPLPSSSDTTPPPETPTDDSSPSRSASAPGAEDTEKAEAPATKKAAPELCDPGLLRATLTGKQNLKPREAVVFRLSLINGSKTTCAISVNAEMFELKIYSGTDRIWSTGDCETAVKPIDKTLGPEKAVGWRMTWNGLRSAPGCKSRAAVPEPGTYFATAQLADAKPVQLRMTLHG